MEGLTTAYAFDTLGFTKRLEAGGVGRPQAETHAEAARDFIMAELVTKTDLAAAMEALTLRITLRIGSMIAGAIPLTVGALALLQHLMH